MIRNGYIYTLSDPTTKAVRYIGQTINIKQRYKSHIYDAKHGSKLHVYNWIRKLICDNKRPKIDIIHECEEDDLNFWEVYYINHFKKLGCELTNKTNGGQERFVYTTDVINEMRKKSTKYQIIYSINIKTREIKKHTSTLDIQINLKFNKKESSSALRCCHHKDGCKSVKGFVFVFEHEFISKSTDEILETANKKLSNNKPVIQYSLEGNFIKEFISANSAAKEVNTTMNSIWNCCNAISYRKIAKGYQWKWKESNDYPLKINAFIKNRNFKIGQYSLEGKLLATYDSIIDASNKTGIGYNSIQNCVAKQHGSADGFMWINAENVIPKHITPYVNGSQISNLKHSKAVIQYDLNGKMINEFSTIRKAAVETKLGNGIRNCVSGRCKSSGGYIWRLKDN